MRALHACGTGCCSESSGRRLQPTAPVAGRRLQAGACDVIVFAYSASTAEAANLQAVAENLVAEATIDGDQVFASAAGDEAGCPSYLNFTMSATAAISAQDDDLSKLPGLGVTVTRIYPSPPSTPPEPPPPPSIPPLTADYANSIVDAFASGEVRLLLPAKRSTAHAPPGAHSPCSAHLRRSIRHALRR